MTRKRDGAFGVAAQAKATTPAATPKIYCIGTDHNIEGTPVLTEELNPLSPDPIEPHYEGKDYTWTTGGINPTCAVLGYFLWLFCGAESNVSDVHTITLADASKYLTPFSDRDMDLGTSTPTERLTGGKIDQMSIEFKPRSWAVFEASGPGLSLATPVAALSPSIAAGAANRPISWRDIVETANGWFKTQVNGVALADDTGIRSAKITFTREVAADEFDASGIDSTGATEGKRKIAFELTRSFTGANALAEYNAWKNAQQVGFEVKAMVGTNYVTLTIPQAHITGSYAPPIGDGQETIVGTLRAEAFTAGASAAFTAVVKDGSAVAYS